MRVAYLTAEFGVPVTKGASAHVRGLVEALRSDGHDSFSRANIGENADLHSPARGEVRRPRGLDLSAYVLGISGSELSGGVARLGKGQIAAAWERVDHAAGGKCVSS